MKKKKVIILVIAVLAICALGVVTSYYMNWPVDTKATSGDIAKSNRFSRKTVNNEVSNMQELLASDKEYRDKLVVAHTVMQTRANQFDALVDMSVEAAGNIKDFDAILADMKAVKPMVKNVCSSMESAGADLNAAIGGETRSDLNQNTNNAALAYSTLQKQNELADRFIEAVDKYVRDSQADDRLKLVRDQWVEYQLMTAALNNDTKASQKLESSGYLLTSDNAVAALGSFGKQEQAKIFGVALLDQYIGFNPAGQLSNIETFGHLVGEFEQKGIIASVGGRGLAAQTNKDGLIAQTNKDGLIAQTNKDGLIAQTNKDGLIAQTNKDGLIASMNKDDLLAAIPLDMLHFDGAGMASAFGEATKAMQNFNQSGMASHEVSGGLLHLDPSGLLGHTISPTIVSLSSGAEQNVANFRGGGVQSRD